MAASAAHERFTSKYDQSSNWVAVTESKAKAKSYLVCFEYMEGEQSDQGLDVQYKHF